MIVVACLCDFKCEPEPSGDLGEWKRRNSPTVSVNNNNIWVTKKLVFYAGSFHSSSLLRL